MGVGYMLDKIPSLIFKFICGYVIGYTLTWIMMICFFMWILSKIISQEIKLMSTEYMIVITILIVLAMGLYHTFNGGDWDEQSV